MTESLLQQLASTGVVGAFLVLTLIALKWERDRGDKIQVALDAEKDARIEDSRLFNTQALALQNQVNANIAKLGEVVDLIERREAEIEDARRGVNPKSTTPYRRQGG